MTKTNKENGDFGRWDNAQQAAFEFRELIAVMHPGMCVPISRENLSHLGDVIDQMVKGLERAIVIFRDYEAHHLARISEGPSRLAKAGRNKRIADYLESLIKINGIAKTTGGGMVKSADPGPDVVIAELPSRTPPTSEAGINDNPIVRAIIADLASGDSSVVGPSIRQWLKTH